MTTLQTLEPESLAELDKVVKALRLLGWRIERFDRLRDRGFVVSFVPPGSPPSSSDLSEGRREG